MYERVKEWIFFLGLLIPTLVCVHLGNLILALVVAFVLSALAFCVVSFCD